jgi:hypothetical protein
MVTDDRLYLALTLCKRSLVAEFYEAFGKEMTEKFITLFGTTYLRVPTSAEVERNLRDIAIYQHLVNRPNDLKGIMTQYSVTIEKLESILKKVSAEQTTLQQIPPGIKRRPRLPQLPAGTERKPRT